MFDSKILWFAAGAVVAWWLIRRQAQAKPLAPVLTLVRSSEPDPITTTPGGCA
jgi:hypothetical protein